MGASILDALANYNPAGFALDNQQRQANVGHTQAQTGLAQQQTGLAAQQAQEAATRNKAMQIQMRDEQILGDAFRVSGGDAEATAKAAIQQGISPGGFFNFRDQHTKYMTGLATLDRDKLANESAMNSQVGAVYNTLANTPDEQLEAAIPSAVAQLRQADPTHPVDPNKLADRNYLKLQIGLKGYEANALEQAAKAQGLKQGAVTMAEGQQKLDAGNRTQAAQDVQQVFNEDGIVNPSRFASWQEKYKDVLPRGITPDPAVLHQYAESIGVPLKDQPEFKINQARVAAMKNMNETTVSALVDSIIPPKNEYYTEQNRTAKAMAIAAVKNGATPEEVNKIVDGAANRINAMNTSVEGARQKAPITISVHTAEQGARTAAATPSSDALDFMAEDALAGKMPASRNMILYSKVMDRAAQLAKERGLTAQQAVMERNAASANRTAFTAVTKQYETLKPFAEMAEKNANILEQKAAGVSDLGAAFLNTPVRELQNRFGGNTAVAAYRAALLPVQADFARILNSPTGAGVLSDNARHEMQSALPDGATVGQIKAALDVFRQDARNRRESYEAQLTDLKGRTVVGNTTHTQPQLGFSGGGALPKGGGKAADAGVIQQYLQSNGGDKDKTRKALGDAGWVIPKAQ